MSPADAKHANVPGLPSATLLLGLITAYLMLHGRGDRPRRDPRCVLAARGRTRHRSGEQSAVGCSPPRPDCRAYLQVTFGWRAAFVFLTAFALMVTWATWRKLDETNQHKDRKPSGLRD